MPGVAEADHTEATDGNGDSVEDAAAHAALDGDETMEVDRPAAGAERRELEVVAFNFAARAQRRLQRHARRAQVRRVVGTLTVEECVDVDEPAASAGAPGDVSSEEDVSILAQRGAGPRPPTRRWPWPPRPSGRGHPGRGLPGRPWRPGARPVHAAALLAGGLRPGLPPRRTEPLRREAARSRSRARARQDTRGPGHEGGLDASEDREVDLDSNDEALPSLDDQSLRVDEGGQEAARSVVMGDPYAAIELEQERHQQAWERRERELERFQLRREEEERRMLERGAEEAAEAVPEAALAFLQDSLDDVVDLQLSPSRSSSSSSAAAIHQPPASAAAPVQSEDAWPPANAFSEHPPAWPAPRPWAERDWPDDGGMRRLRPSGWDRAGPARPQPQLSPWLSSPPVPPPPPPPPAPPGGGRQPSQSAVPLGARTDAPSAWIVPGPPAPEPREAHFYVELVRHGMGYQTCSACHEPFLVGTLRLGFAPRGTGLETHTEPMWIHVPRCVGRVGLNVREADRVCFSHFVPGHERARVMEELMAQQRRSNMVGLLALPPLLATRTWRHQLAALQLWPETLVPAALGPPARAGAVSSPQPSAALMPVQQWARMAAARIGPPVWPSGVLAGMPPPPARAAQAEAATVEALLSAVPVQILAEQRSDNCVICYEAMLGGQEARRLPCLHMFHRECIDRWLRIKPTCPLDNLRLEDMISRPESLFEDASPGAAR